MHVLHLPGALKIDPPGSTHRWCFLWLELSAGDTKQGAVLLKRVRASNKLGGVRARAGMVRRGSCMTCELGAEGVASIRRAGGGSSGLSSCGAAIGGT